MKISRGLTILLGACTLWPIIYMLLFMGVIFASVVGNFLQSDSSFGLPSMYSTIFALHLLTIMEIFALLAFYIVYLFKTDRVAEDKKALWAVVLFLGHAIAMPVFWYHYVWREADPELQPNQLARHPNRLRDLSTGIIAVIAVGLLFGILAMLLGRGDPLHDSAKDGDLDRIRELLDGGAHVDRTDEDGRTALWIATLHGQNDAANLLLNSDANPNLADRWLGTPLHVAAKQGYPELVTLLLENNAELDEPHRWGITPLWLAAESGHAHIVALFLERGASVDASTECDTALHVAAFGGHIDIVESLIDAGAQIDDQNNFHGYTPLHSAISRDREEIVQFLLESGADPSLRDKDGNDALAHSRAKHVQAEKSEKVLLQYGK